MTIWELDPPPPRPRPRGALRRWLRDWYRRLTGKCIVCGGRRLRRTEVWRHPSPWACQWCNKRMQHGMNYGMGPRKLGEMVR